VDEQRTDGTNDAEARAEFTRAVEVNTHTLSQLIHEFRSLRESLAPFTDGVANGGTPATSDRAVDPSDPDDLAEAERRLAEATEENLELRSRLDQTQADLQELRHQNEDLASRVANSQVRASIATSDSGAADALSWEERKALILRQMEEESFDADAVGTSERPRRDSGVRVASSEVGGVARRGRRVVEYLSEVDRVSLLQVVAHVVFLIRIGDVRPRDSFPRRDGDVSGLCPAVERHVSLVFAAVLRIT